MLHVDRAELFEDGREGGPLSRILMPTLLQQNGQKLRTGLRNWRPYALIIVRR